MNKSTYFFIQYDCLDGSDEQNCPDAQQNGTIELPTTIYPESTTIQTTTALPPIFGDDFYPGGTPPNNNNGKFWVLRNISIA